MFFGEMFWRDIWAPRWSNVGHFLKDKFPAKRRRGVGVGGRRPMREMSEYSESRWSMKAPFCMVSNEKKVTVLFIWYPLALKLRYIYFHLGIRHSQFENKNHSKWPICKDKGLASSAWQPVCKDNIRLEKCPLRTADLISHIITRTTLE